MSPNFTPSGKPPGSALIERRHSCAALARNDVGRQDVRRVRRAVAAAQVEPLVAPLRRAAEHTPVGRRCSAMPKFGIVTHLMELPVARVGRHAGGSSAPSTFSRSCVKMLVVLHAHAGLDRDAATTASSDPGSRRRSGARRPCWRPWRRAVEARAACRARTARRAAGRARRTEIELDRRQRRRWSSFAMFGYRSAPPRNSCSAELFRRRRSSTATGRSSSGARCRCAPKPPSSAIVVRLPRMLPVGLLWMILVGISPVPAVRQHSRSAC